MSKLSREILLANCRIRSGNVGGSGTVIYSKEEKDGFSTYVLTNQHVVDNSIETKKRWSPLLRRDIKDDVFATVETHFFKYQYQSRAIGATAIQTDIMSYDKDEDLALLRIRDSDAVPSVVKMLPRDQVSELRLGQDVYTIGAALGEPPIITKGILSQFGREIDNREYWICTAPIIYGNSGGATYLVDTDELIGVPARIALAGGIFSSSTVTHLGFIVPVTRIYKFLEDQLFRFIYDPSFTEEGEAEERKRRRKLEEMKMAAREDTGQEQEGDPPEDKEADIPHGNSI